MSRASLVELIDGYADRYAEERDTCTRIRDFVQAHDNCFDRELLVGHITGSAWILNAKGDAALLTHHRKLDIWVQLGGHADGDSDVQRVAEKEALEESGLTDLVTLSAELFDIDIHEIPERKGEPAHYHYDCRFLLQATNHEYTVSDESHDLKWIPLQEMTSYTTEESVLRMVGKTQSWLERLSKAG